MQLRNALMATTLLISAPVAAMADSFSGPYVSLGAGYNLVQTQHAHFGAGTYASGAKDENPSRSRFRHGPGVTGLGSFGYGLNNGFRAEIEGVYNYSNLRKSRPGLAAHGTAKGHDTSYGALANVFYDLDFTQFGINLPVEPYVGAGVGYIFQRGGKVTTTFDDGSTNNVFGTRGSFSYQGIVGAAYEIRSVPGLALTTEYRMLAQTNKTKYKSTSFNTVDASVHNGKVKFDPRFNHQFILGLRYAFAAAPLVPIAAAAAATAGAPQVAPARTYLVFFDFDRSNLTAKAREIVANAAQASTQVQTTRIEVNGYTDNSAAHPGPRGQRYNQALSVRRAESVKAELIRNGVPASAIDIRGYGEQNPLVPTGPNTREPQNRRVEIILH